VRKKQDKFVCIFQNVVSQNRTFLGKSYALRSSRLRSQAWTHVYQMLNDKNAPVITVGLQLLDPIKKNKIFFFFFFFLTKSKAFYLVTKIKNLSAKLVSLSFLFEKSTLFYISFSEKISKHG
jgi:hypothetical protein